MDSPREDHPRISIESYKDLRFIQNNIREAFNARLRTELESARPPINEQLISFRLNEYLESVFDIATPNLRINGRSYEDDSAEQEELEAFDEALDRHIWSLSDQMIKWDKELAELRRSKPGEIVDLLQKAYNKHAALANEESQDNDEEMADETQHDEAADIEQRFSQTTSLATQLLQVIPVQHERADRFRVASAEVKSIKT